MTKKRSPNTIPREEEARLLYEATIRIRKKISRLIDEEDSLEMKYDNIGEYDKAERHYFNGRALMLVWGRSCITFKQILEGRMTKEQIEKAVNDYIGFEPEVDEDLGTSQRRRAFKDGAEWRINSVWHEASEAPEKNKYIALMFKNGNLTSWYVTDDIMQKLKEHKVMIWAYVNDLMPGIKEETE